jgi:hypothetical protein
MTGEGNKAACRVQGPDSADPVFVLFVAGGYRLLSHAEVLRGNKGGRGGDGGYLTGCSSSERQTAT